MRSDLTRYERGDRDPAAREAHRRYERDRRHAIDAAENRTSIAFLAQYVTPHGIVATCHRDLAVVFAGLVTETNGRGGRRRATRMRDHTGGNVDG